MSQEAEQALGLIKWWKELTGLLLGILALFGIFIKSKKGANLVTEKVLINSLKLALAEHAKEEREFIEEMITKVYDDMHRADADLNDKIFDLAKK